MNISLEQPIRIPDQVQFRTSNKILENLRSTFNEDANMQRMKQKNELQSFLRIHFFITPRMYHQTFDQKVL